MVQLLRETIQIKKTQIKDKCSIQIFGIILKNSLKTTPFYVLFTKKSQFQNCLFPRRQTAPQTSHRAPFKMEAYTGYRNSQTLQASRRVYNKIYNNSKDNNKTVMVDLFWMRFKWRQIQSDLMEQRGISKKVSEINGRRCCNCLKEIAEISVVSTVLTYFSSF